MDAGFDGASLAVFTALSPAGAIAYLCLAVILLARGSLDDQGRVRLERLLCVPLGVAWVGFIASATHLGTPANALHVIWGIGRSPLSNEVAAAVVFLFTSGVCWMYAFKEHRRARVQKAFLGISAVSALVMVGFTSMAYSIPTVPSWDTWLTPANLWMAACTAGPSLAAFALHAAQCRGRVWLRGCLAVSAAALCVGTVLLFVHMQVLGGISNNVSTAAELVPGYGASAVLHFVLGGAGIAVQFAAARVSSLWRSVALSGAGCAMVLVAVLLTRIPFYEAYLSVGF